MILETKNPCNSLYIAGACNANPFAADWGENNIICLAIDEAIGILKSNLSEKVPGQIERTLLAHKDRVNVVKWIRNFNNNQENSFVSGSVDCNAIVWVPNNGSYLPRFILKGHVESVLDVSAVSIKWQGINHILVASLSINALKLWKKSEHEDEFSCYCTVDSAEGHGVAGLSFGLLPNTNSLIFASCRKFVDISLYTCSLNAINNNDLSGFREATVLNGHTNWVNDLTFTTCDNGYTLLLASASNDCTIRIWRIFKQKQNRSELDLREVSILVDEKQFSVTLYSILHGHDQWVYTVQWKHFPLEEKKENRLKLLSVSADKTVIIWQQDFVLNTWTEKHRLGDVGGNISGFLGGCFDPTGQFVMTHDLVGAFHVWCYNKNTDNWSSAILPSGHNDTVNDIQWDPKGQFLMSVSNDKTTRLHAPWSANSSYWFEFSRPQTHGHIISCVTVLPQNRFVSGASEKELRSFIAPKNFIQNFKKFSFLEDVDESKYPHNNAVLPSLDLSNKPADEMENINIDSKYCDTMNLAEDNRTIPTEEELVRNTLWPEIQKLYYHPNEISCITSNFDGTLIASACKANSPKEAAVAIWSVKWDNIERIQELWFHQLTVTQLAFSPDSMFLLTISRDRTWHLFKKKAECTDKELTFESVAYATKTNAIHKRQLHSCAWSHDSLYFATGSRDGKMVIWSQQANNSGNAGETVTNESLNGFRSRYVLTVDNENICAIAFAPDFLKPGEYFVAIGFSSGKIGLYIWNNVECREWHKLENFMAHNKVVTKLAFRPVCGPQNYLNKRGILQLASAGTDRLIKIYNLNVTHV